MTWKTRFTRIYDIRPSVRPPSSVRPSVRPPLIRPSVSAFYPNPFSNLMREFGIKHKRITPRYPGANGEAERLNRSINKVVKTAIAESRDWRKAIDDWLLAYRTTHIRSLANHQPPQCSGETSTTSSRRCSHQHQ